MDAIVWLGLVTAAFWFAWYLRRLQHYWDMGEARVVLRGRTLRQTQRALADERRLDEVIRHEVKRAQAQAQTAQRNAQSLRQKQRDAVPPPPSEILVAAEFPSSAKEEPWIANLTPRAAPLPGSNGGHAMIPVLFWASSYQTAQGRSQNIARSLRLALNDIRRLEDAKM